MNIRERKEILIEKIRAVEDESVIEEVLCMISSKADHKESIMLSFEQQ